ncbi:MAG: hypothetical protein ACYCYP_11250 [Leptospirales bacterium]
MKVIHSSHYSAEHRGSISGDQSGAHPVRRVVLALGYLLLMGALVVLIYKIILFLMPPALYE